MAAAATCAMRLLPPHPPHNSHPSSPLDISSAPALRAPVLPSRRPTRCHAGWQGARHPRYH